MAGGLLSQRGEAARVRVSIAVSVVSKLLFYSSKEKANIVVNLFYTNF